jgi:hypothetical protein
VECSARDRILDRFKPYLQRCAAGVTSTAQLLDEITARGYTGRERTLRRWLVGIRGDEPVPPPVPRARDITGWILRPTRRLLLQRPVTTGTRRHADARGRWWSPH